MNLSKKLEYAEQAVKSISQHSDIDSVVRLAALDRVIAMAEAEKAAVNAEAQKDLAAELGKTE